MLPFSDSILMKPGKGSRGTSAGDWWVVLAVVLAVAAAGAGLLMLARA